MFPSELKAVTLNCWGVPLMARHKTQRMNAIGDWLAQSDYDFVFLQELWLSRDIDIVVGKASSAYQHSHFFHSGAAGSGMCVLSRHPLTDCLFHRCAVNGFAHHIHHGDWFGGKGVGLCCAQVGPLRVHLYITHLHANYNKSCDIYHCHRLLQSFDAVQFVRLTAGRADVALFAGDFNASPGELAYNLITQCSGLRDAFYLSTGQNDACVEPATCEAPHNSYTCQSGSHHSQITPPATNKHPAPPPCGERIDLVFIAAGARNTQLHQPVCVERVQHCLPLSSRVPGARFSYSDHEAVQVTLTLTEAGRQREGLCVPLDCCPPEGRSALVQAIEVCEKYMRSLHWDQIFYTVVSVLLLIVILGSLVATSIFSATNADAANNHGSQWWRVLVAIVRIAACMVLAYTAFMASVWNCIERAGVRAGMAEMRVTLAACCQTVQDRVASQSGSSTIAEQNSPIHAANSPQNDQSHDLLNLTD